MLAKPSGTGAKVVAVLAMVLCPTAGLADKVTLESDDGFMTITGELISFENGIYTILSNMGNVGVPATLVTCTGEGCPAETETAADPAAPTDSLAAVDGPAPSDASVSDAPSATAEPVPLVENADAPAVIEPAPVADGVTGTEVVATAAESGPAIETAAEPAAPVETPATPEAVDDPVALPVYETFDPSRIDFTIKGSDTVGDELMPLLIKGSAESLDAVIQRTSVGERQSVHTALGAEGAGDALFSIFLEDKGSSTGFKALLDGSASLAMSSRAVKSEEVEAFVAAGLGDPSSFEQEHAIAIDGLLVVVHPDNTVGGLSFEQVSGLLSGTIANWSEVGGPDQPVSVYTRNTESGTFATIVDTFLKPFGQEISPKANTVSGNAEMTDSVFSDPGAIGYVGFAYQKDSRPVDIVSPCGIVSTPNAFSAKTGEYPLQRTLYLYNTDAELPPMAAALINYATSDAATDFVEKSGFIGYNVEAGSMERQAEILRGMIENSRSPSEQKLMSELYDDMGKWERLSTTFRFKTGSSTLENQSRRDLERLAAFMAAEGEGREFVFVGFTDSDGPVEANRKLGLARAESMRAELEAVLAPEIFAKLSIEAKGYGEINPVGCNTDFTGQRLNRRVEIWMR